MLTVIKYLSYMDWLRPLLTVLQNFLNGPSHTFLLPEQEGWSAAEIERRLRKKGIKTWGLDIVGNTITISTRLAQAGLAESILRQERIVVENPTESAPRSRGVKKAADHGKAKPARQGDLIDDFNTILDSWLGLS